MHPHESKEPTHCGLCGERLASPQEYEHVLASLDRFERVARIASRAASTLDAKLPHQRVAQAMTKLRLEMVRHMYAYGDSEQLARTAPRCEACGEVLFA